jgi:DNA invertase Pin-like site-specific DNA recombinase
MRKVTPTQRAVAYVRTAQASATTAGQEAHCRQIARAASLHVDAVYHDLGVSGLREQRPGLSRLLRDIKRQPAAAVVVASLDRIARSLPVALKIEKQISRHGAELLDGQPKENDDV